MTLKRGGRNSHMTEIRFARNCARSLCTATAVRAAFLWVDTCRMVSPLAAFGEVKGSGHGCESGFRAIYDHTRRKRARMNTSDDPMANPSVMH